MVTLNNYWEYFKSQTLPHQIALISSILLMIGLSTSPALMSIGSAGIFFAFLTDWKNIKSNLHKIQSPIYWTLFLLYFLHLIHIYHTTNLSQLWTELRIKLPFLLIPLGFVSFKPQKKDFYIIAFFFIITISTVSLLNLMNYFLHFEEINQRILESKEVPVVTKVSHIYFSVILAFAILLSFYLYQNLSSKFYLVLSLFLFFCIHLFTSRTGLVALYFAIFISLLFYLKKNHHTIIGIIGILLLFALPFLAYYTLPSFKNRIVNTIEDIQRYQNKQDINHRSISMRLVAWEMCFYAFQKSPWLGIGMENISYQLKDEYAYHQVPLDKENWLNDLHNQYLEYLLGLGIIGLLLFLFWFFYPLFFNQSNFLQIQFLAILFSAMFVESLLERQLGVCFGIFWYYFTYINSSK